MSSTSRVGNGEVVMLDRSHLRDPSLYVRVPNVPVFDAHKHAKKGDVDEQMLRLIAENTNERAKKGAMPLLLLGHTFDGDGHEDEQPESVGVALDYRVKDFQGRPCIYADFYYKRKDYDRAGEYPHRSVERVKSESDPETNYLESVALLRRSPDRPLGVLTRHASELPEGASRERYELETVDRDRLARNVQKLRERYAADLKKEPALMKLPNTQTALGQDDPGPDDRLAQDKGRLHRNISKLKRIHGGRRYKGPSVRTKLFRDQSSIEAERDARHAETMSRYESDAERERYLLGTLAAGAVAAGVYGARKPIAASIGARMGAMAPQKVHQAAGMAKRAGAVAGEFGKGVKQGVQQGGGISEGSLLNTPKWVGEGYKAAGQATKLAAKGGVAAAANPALPPQARLGGAAIAGLAGGAYLGGKAIQGVARGIGGAVKDVGQSFAEGWKSQAPENQAQAPAAEPQSASAGNQPGDEMSKTVDEIRQEEAKANLDAKLGEYFHSQQFGARVRPKWRVNPGTASAGSPPPSAQAQDQGLSPALQPQPPNPTQAQQPPMDEPQSVAPATAPAPTPAPVDPRAAAQQAQMARSGGARPRAMDEPIPSDERRQPPRSGAPAIRRTQDGRVFDAGQFRKNLEDFYAGQPTPAAQPIAPSGFESRLEEAMNRPQSAAPAPDPFAEQMAEFRADPTGAIGRAERAGVGDEIRRMAGEGRSHEEIAAHLGTVAKIPPDDAARMVRAVAPSAGQSAAPAPPVDEPQSVGALDSQSSAPPSQPSPAVSPQPAPPERVQQVITTPSGNRVKASLDPATAKLYNAGDPRAIEHVHRLADEHANSRPWKTGQPDLPNVRRYENPTRPGAVRVDMTDRHSGRPFPVEFPSEAHAYLWEAGRMAKLAADPDADEDTREQAEANLHHLANEFKSFGLSSPQAIAAAGRAYFRDINRMAKWHSGTGPVLAPESSVFANQETRDWTGKDSPDMPGMRPGVMASMVRAMGGKPSDEPYRTTVQNVHEPGSLINDSVGAHAAVHRNMEAIPESMRGGMWTVDQNIGQPVMQGPSPRAVHTDPFWKQMSERGEYPKGVALQLRPDQIKVVPAISQHRVHTQGKYGAGSNLDDVETWDHDKAGNLEVWQATYDIPEHGISKGDVILMGGHTRYDAARRLGIDYHNVVFMDAATPQKAKLKAAINNISGGTVDPIDAAKVFREMGMPPEKVVSYLKKSGTSMGKATVAAGMGISRLPAPIWSQIMREYQHGLPPSVPHDKLATIGDMGLDEQDATAVFRHAAANKGISNGQLKAFGSMIRQARTEEANSPPSGEMDLFGDPVDDPSYMKAAAIADKIRETLASEARLMGQVSKKKAADAIGEHGVGQIDADAAIAHREHRKNLMATFDQDFQLGRFHGTLLELARSDVSPQKAAALVIRELEKRYAEKSETN